MSPKKIIVGLSGGVDSCVSLLLLKRQGYDPIGVTLKYSVWNSQCPKIRENICCTKESRETARKICQKYRARHIILDKTEEFDRVVVEYFKNELKAGRTPNPCVVCNRNLKFKALLETAEQYGAEWIATGHYARVTAKKREQTKESGTGKKHELRIGKDKKKDQTYSLSFLKQEQLRRCVFPLGDYTKQEVRKIAEEEGLMELATKKESQDFCFVSGKEINDFLRKEIGLNPGDIVDTDGKKLGKHQGLHFYTLGQKRKLQLSVPVPYYVVKKDIEANTLIVSRDPEDPQLYSQEVILYPVNIISPVTFPKKVRVKTRYHERLAEAELVDSEQKTGGKLRLLFTQPHRAVTPGQFAVFYEGEKCLGGGRIE